MMWTDNPEEDYDRYLARPEASHPKCDECGEPIEDEYLFDVDGQILCEGCFGEIYGHTDEPRACEQCGKYDDFYFIIGDRLYCEQCARHEFRRPNYG